MIKLNPLSILFVFCLCFSSFFLGWLMAVYFFPGKSMELSFTKSEISDFSDFLSKEKTTSLQPAKTNKAIPFFEEIKSHIFILFDPYKMDVALKKETHLKQEKSYIKKTSPLSLKQKVFKLKKPRVTSHKEKENLEEGPKEALSFLIKEENHVLQERQAKYDQANQKQLYSILDRQNFFTKEGKFGFLINVFSNEKEAEEYVENMKEDYPLFSFLIKLHANHVRIYLGPIPTKEKALEFKKQIPLSAQTFSLDFLEEISL